MLKSIRVNHFEVFNSQLSPMILIVLMNLSKTNSLPRKNSASRLVIIY